MSQKRERREKGTGTVYQDKNGIWRGKLRYTPEPHAKQVTVNFRVSPKRIFVSKSVSTIRSHRLPPTRT